jgi:hypothetical protein
VEGLSVLFYSADGWEPPHVHVAKDGKEAKVWLRDLAVAVNIGYSAKDLHEIVVACRDHRSAFMEAWNDHFGA